MCGVGYFTSMIWASTMIPISLVTILYNMAPFWTSIAGYLINGEKIILCEFVAMLICLALVTALALMKEDPTASGAGGLAGVSSQHVLGVIVCVVGSLVNTGMNISNRRLQGTHFSVVMFFHAILGFTIPAIAVLIYIWATGTTMLSYPAVAWKWIFFGSVSDIFACLFNVIAFQNDNSGFLAVMNYSGIVYAFLADICIFNIAFSGLQLLLTLGIFVTTMVMAVFKYRLSLEEAKYRQKSIN